MATGAISFTRYVVITSGVGAGANVAERQLIGRLFTTNNMLPPQTIIEFDVSTDASAVGTYFGFSSVEYLRAQFYAAWISKNITKPSKISFARWVDAAVGARIYGAVGTYAVGTFTPISNGSIGITLNGFTTQLTSIDFTSAVSLANVASTMQTKIRAFTSGGTPFTGAVVTYDATNRRFNFVSGSTGTDVIAITAGATGTDVAALLGWLTGAILANGSAVETITQTLTSSAQLSNNFGSYLFLPILNLSQITESATWNSAQNVMFQYMVPVTAANAAATSAAIFNLAGNAMTLAPITTEYPEQVPMMILAATDYDARNSVQNYMFQQFVLTPSVTTDADATTYTTLRVNFYGQTQTAGQFLAFYQNGVLTGLPANPVDQNTYANEQWLKDASGSQIMTLLLALARVSANVMGRSQLMGIIQPVITRALFNGTISVGKALTPVQQLFITSATGDDMAWYQVQSSGYWFNLVFTTYVDTDSITKYKAKYTLIYSKDDVIRKVEGQDILI